MEAVTNPRSYRNLNPASTMQRLIEPIEMSETLSIQEDKPGPQRS